MIANEIKTLKNRVQLDAEACRNGKVVEHAAQLVGSTADLVLHSSGD
jgi:hypothetical protein